MKISSAFTITALSFGLSACFNNNPFPMEEQTTLIPPVLTDTIPQIKEKSTRKIKLAILLDTSGSMDGLIEQTKNQLWKIVTQLAKAKDEKGRDPKIELALYHYGNDGNGITTNYIQQISGFTSELDDISEHLFALTTNGGSEYCGAVISDALSNLKWSSNPDDLQFIYIAGNEEFTQGPIAYSAACELSKKNGIIVNTIFCGDYNEGVNTFWKNGAELTGGKYMNINSDAAIVHIESPYDQQIGDLNIQLNQTYIYYGTVGKSKKEKQINEDLKAESSNKSLATKRYISKSSKVYSNSSWDLVDAKKERNIDINSIDKTTLPEEFQNLDSMQLQAKIKEMEDKRAQIKKQMSELNKKREDYVAQERSKLNTNQDAQLEDAIITSLVEIAKRKKFTFAATIE